MEVKQFTQSAEAFGFAERKAKYGHKNWLVWQEGEEWRSALQCLETAERAVRVMRPERPIYLVEANTAIIHRFGMGGAHIMLRNYQNGYLV